MATVRPTGSVPAGDYTSLKAAIDNPETSITIETNGTEWTADETVTVTTTISSDTTITVTGNAKHHGYAHAGTGEWHRYRKTGTGAHIFTVTASLTITGMDIEMMGTGDSDEVFRWDSGAGDLTLTDCVVGFDTRNSSQDIWFTFQSATFNLLFTNCMFYGALQSVCALFETSGDVAIDFVFCHTQDIGNDTSPGSRDGVVGVTDNTSNVSIQSFYGAYHINTGFPFSGPTVSTANDVVSDFDITNKTAITNGSWGTETVTNDLVSRTWTTNQAPGVGAFVIVHDLTNPFDLRLKNNPTDNDAQDRSDVTDGPGALTPPATDIVGNARPQNTNFDVGAYEVASYIHAVLTVQRRRQTQRLLTM